MGCVAGSTSAWLAENGVGGPGIGMAAGWLTSTGNSYIKGARGGDVIIAGGYGAMAGGISGFVTQGLGELLNIPIRVNSGSGYVNPYTLEPVQTETTIGNWLFGNINPEVGNRIFSQGAANSSIILASFNPENVSGGTKFFEAKVRFIPESFSASSYVAGAINTFRSTYNNYLKLGLNSVSGKYLMHEYGHYLQSKYGGKFWYSVGVVPTSLINYQRLSTFKYNRTWTEVQANTMSYYYFHFPEFWDFDEYPINHEFISDELKSKLYFHKE